VFTANSSTQKKRFFEQLYLCPPQLVNVLSLSIYFTTGDNSHKLHYNKDILQHTEVNKVPYMATSSHVEVCLIFVFRFLW